MNIKYVTENNKWIIDLDEEWVIQEDKDLNNATSLLRENNIPYSVDYLPNKSISLMISIGKEVDSVKEASGIINALLVIQEKLVKIKTNKTKNKIIEPKVVPEQKPLFEPTQELDKVSEQPTHKNIFSRR